MTKKEKKAFAALLQRVTDVYSGAFGEDASADGILAGLFEYERILPALESVFGNQRADLKYLWSSHNSGKYCSPKEATEFLFDNGIRAAKKARE